MLNKQNKPAQKPAAKPAENKNPAAKGKSECSDKHADKNKSGSSCS